MNRNEFCEYIKKYQDQFYVIAYSILKNQADTEDAVGNAIQKAYEHLEQLKNHHKFKAWMITITKNEALQIKRKRLELPGDDQVLGMLEPVYDHHNELWDVIQELPEEYRIVIVMFYYSELSIRDIAKTLGIPVGTVKSRLSRGREMLKKAIGETEKEV